MTSRLDQLSRAGAAGRRHDQHVHAARQLHRRPHIRVRRALDRAPIVIRDRAPESTEPLRDRAADPTQPDDADARVAHLSRQRIVPLGRPPARPHVPVRRRELPHHVDHQPDRGIGHAVGQDVGRIAHAERRAPPRRRRRWCRTPRRSSRPRPGSAAPPSTRRPLRSGPTSPPPLISPPCVARNVAAAGSSGST